MLTYHYISILITGFMGVIPLFQTKGLLNISLKFSILSMFSLFYMIRIITEFTLFGISKTSPVIITMCAIPMIFYSPGHITPGKFEKLTAQIDIGPTILGYLNFSYDSKFFGQDVFKMKEGDERAFISTYQSLGYIKNNKLIILDPNKKVATYQPDFTTGSATSLPADQKLINEAISNYQMASYLYQKGLYSSVPKNK